MKSPINNSYESIQGTLRQMLTWFLSPKSLGLEHDGEHAVHMVANHLAEGYAVLNDRLGSERTSTVSIAGFNAADYQGEDAEYLAPVVELGDWVNREISEHVSEFMIHGSIATLDYSRGWSDFDTFVIVSSDTALNGHALTELRSKLLGAYSYLTTVDPLQHHGFILKKIVAHEFGDEHAYRQKWGFGLPYSFMAKNETVRELANSCAAGLKADGIVGDTKDVFANALAGDDWADQMAWILLSVGMWYDIYFRNSERVSQYVKMPNNGNS